MTDIALLRIEIDEVTPAVIRRVEVPVTIRLDDLHFVLQIAIGWQNCHPFEFRAGDVAWGLRDRDNPDASPLAAERATLADLLARGRSFKYDYVYGEDWTHTVELETIVPAVPGMTYPRLLSAEGRCPPADIGGPIGYETYLRALADPQHFTTRA
jgi:Plasmid pRiA4b ORF-3-like protein